MKLSDLIEKSNGPIIGAPKGSQKDSRLSPGTDDPSKYMRGGEWEAYREPQGVNSNAGKIAGGKKKGKTRTKNTKTSESVEDFSQYGIMMNPDHNYMEKLGKEVAKRSFRDPHIKGFYDPRGRFWVWDGRDDTIHHQQVLVELINDYGFPTFKEWYGVIGNDAKKEGFEETDLQEFYEDTSGYIPFIIAVHSETGQLDEIWTSFRSVIQKPEVQRALGESIKRLLEGLQPGGAGASGDLVARDPIATTMAMFTDTTAQNTEKGKKMAGSEAPSKLVKKTVKKSLDNRPGNINDINEQVNRIVTEAIPTVKPQQYSADYELLDDNNRETLGVARISYGVIELLSVRNDIVEDFTGHIMSRLLDTIVNDADMANANLAIALDDPSDLQHIRFMERYGFRGVGKGILKRTAGSVRPPSVPAVHL